MIKKLEKSDAKIITQIIQQSFHTVAIDFNITKYNCPSHPSFIKIGQVERFFEQNLKLFGYFTQNQLVGLVMLEKTKDDTTTWYIEKLSVLPAYRHHGIGKKLLEYTYSYIQENGGSYISIALINEQD